MPYVNLTIDGKNVLNGDLGDWQAKPPQTFAQYLTPGAAAQPGMKALLMALADAATMSKDLNAQLWNRPSGYDLKVDYQ